MPEWPEADWTHSPEGHDTDGGWEKVDKESAGQAFVLLDLLSQDLAPLEADVHGWTESDRQALGVAQDFNWVSRLLVPPEAVSAENRMEHMELMATFRAALPFAEAERKWLLDDHHREALGRHIGEQKWFEVIRHSEASLVSDGIIRVVRGRDLLQRWWSWRREAGEYAGQGSLDQARYALEGVIGLMAPELGLPETYVALHRAQGEKPPSPETPS
jgi:hypothetical protein